MSQEELNKEIRIRLCKILLSVAEGQKKIEKVRKELTDHPDFDVPLIFRSVAGRSKILKSQTIIDYLSRKGININPLEAELMIFFYDQDHDCSFSFAESYNLFQYGKSNNATFSKYLKANKISPELDNLVFKLITQEVILNREIIRLLNEINHIPDFNVHIIFHMLLDYGCISANSIRAFLHKEDMKIKEGDVDHIMKRLDINKDNVIDFCEFHAFIGFPKCGYTCPCLPCPFCGTRYCRNCLKDIPCYLMGCNHLGMDSLMPCTANQHSKPGAGASFRRYYKVTSQTQIKKNLSQSRISVDKNQNERRKNVYVTKINKKKSYFKKIGGPGGKEGEGEQGGRGKEGGQEGEEGEEYENEEDEEIDNIDSFGKRKFSNKCGVGVLNNGKGYKIMDEREDNQVDYFVDYSNPTDSPLPYPEYNYGKFTDTIHFRAMPRRTFSQDKCNYSKNPSEAGICPICKSSTSGTNHGNNNINNNINLGLDNCPYCFGNNNGPSRNCPFCKYNIHCPPKKTEEEEEIKNNKECPLHSTLRHNCVSPPQNVGQSGKNIVEYEYVYDYQNCLYTRQKVQYEEEDNDE